MSVVGERVRAPKQARSQETFDRLLDSVSVLLAERDYGDITVADIVEGADRTIGAFYARFTDKDAVLLALVERTWDTEWHRFERLLDPALWRERSLEEILRDGLVVTRAIYRQQGPGLKALLLRAAHDEGVRARRIQMLDDVLGSWSRLLLSKRHEIVHPDPESAVSHCFRYVLSVFDHLLLYGPFWPSDEVGPDELAEGLLDFQLRVLGLRG